MFDTEGAPWPHWCKPIPRGDEHTDWLMVAFAVYIAVNLLGLVVCLVVIVKMVQLIGTFR